MDISKINSDTLKFKTKLGSLTVKNNVVTIERQDGTTKEITGAGEYEVNGISVFGYNDTNKNLVYVVETEGLNTAIINNSEINLTQDLVDDMGNLDIVVVGSYKQDFLSKLDPYFIVVTQEVEKVDDLPSEKMSKFTTKKADIMDDASARAIILESK